MILIWSYISTNEHLIGIYVYIKHQRSVWFLDQQEIELVRTKIIESSLVGDQTTERKHILCGLNRRPFNCRWSETRRQRPDDGGISIFRLDYVLRANAFYVSFIKNVDRTTACCIFLLSCSSTEKVSLIVHHAKIYSVDDSFRICEAMAMSEVKSWRNRQRDPFRYQAEQMIDADGKAVFLAWSMLIVILQGMQTDMWKCELFGTKILRGGSC